MCEGVANVCKKHSIPYQEFSVGAGMTNTNKIKLASDDCKTLLLSIPERNMHTPAEVCDLRDIESLVLMTYWYIKELDNWIYNERTTKQ
jgi:endoglucanase